MEKRESNVARLPNEPVSSLTPYAALIMTIACAVIFVARVYFFESVLVHTRLYRPVWQALDANQRRSFMVHNIGATIKVILIAIGFGPFLMVGFLDSTPQSPVSSLAARPTMGDLMIVTIQIFQAMYIFELFYRTRPSYVTTLHHLGTILLGQVGVVLTLHSAEEPDAIYEFMLCYVWGKFLAQSQTTSGTPPQRRREYTIRI
jgi:hypothetical protein